MQHVLDVAAAAVEPRDQIVGRRQRAEAADRCWPRSAAGPAAPDAARRGWSTSCSSAGAAARRPGACGIPLPRIRRLESSPLLRDDRAVVLDAPDRRGRKPPRRSAAAQTARNRHQRSPKLTVTPSTPPAIAVAIPIRSAADGGGQEHGRKIRREEDVGTDLREAPPRRVVDRARQPTANADAEQQRGLGNSLPASPEFVDQFLHRRCHFT